jgi:hypothetical protein
MIWEHNGYKFKIEFKNKNIRDVVLADPANRTKSFVSKDLFGRIKVNLQKLEHEVSKMETMTIGDTIGSGAAQAIAENDAFSEITIYARPSTYVSAIYRDILISLYQNISEMLTSPNYKWFARIPQQSDKDRELKHIIMDLTSGWTSDDHIVAERFYRDEAYKIRNSDRPDLQAEDSLLTHSRAHALAKMER